MFGDGPYAVLSGRLSIFPRDQEQAVLTYLHVKCEMSSKPLVKSCACKIANKNLETFVEREKQCKNSLTHLL